MAVSIRKKSFREAFKRHYKKIGEDWGENLVRFHVPGKVGQNWWDADARGSCAIRISIALIRAGVDLSPILPKVRRKWYHKRRKEYYPSRAADFVDIPILDGGERLSGTAADMNKSIRGRKGVIYFGGAMTGFSGHITMWDGAQCHYRDAYWGQPTIVFWEMSP